MLDEHIPSREAWTAAFEACRSYPGMGDLKVQFNPYECRWTAEISFSNNTRYTHEWNDVNEALKLVARDVRANPPKI